MFWDRRFLALIPGITVFLASWSDPLNKIPILWQCDVELDDIS